MSSMACDSMSISLAFVDWGRKQLPERAANLSLMDCTKLFLTARGCPIALETHSASITDTVEMRIVLVVRMSLLVVLFLLDC